MFRILLKREGGKNLKCSNWEINGWSFSSPSARLNTIPADLTGRITDYHFAPTEKARENLLAEEVQNERIIVTGNTVIDSLLSVLDKARLIPFSDEILNQVPSLNEDSLPRIVLVTGHRRENFGQSFDNICHSCTSTVASPVLVLNTGPNAPSQSPTSKSLTC